MERIAALLLSLAGLAERAASRSAPIRIVVLWLLYRARLVAADFIMATEPDAEFWQDWIAIAPDRSGYDPADALVLALSLRLLALVVRALAHDAARHPDEAAISSFVDRIARIGFSIKQTAPPNVELCDTS